MGKFKTSMDMMDHSMQADSGQFDVLTFTLEPRDEFGDDGTQTFTILPARRGSGFDWYGGYPLTITASIEQILVNALFARGTITASQASEACRFVAEYDKHHFDYDPMIGDSYANVMQQIMDL